jgi:hypothetical protein
MQTIYNFLTFLYTLSSLYPYSAVIELFSSAPSKKHFFTNAVNSAFNIGPRLVYAFIFILYYTHLKMQL